MRSSRVAVCILTACLILNSFGLAQEVPLSSAPASAATVPRLIRIRGVVRDETGKPLNGNIGITFSLYRDENDQVAVWQENQNLQLNSGGRYSALLGATNEAGLPLEIFSAGEARWLGVRPEGQSEQPRILFLSVAYALKAADTDLLGGKPASAFVLADGQNSSVTRNDAERVTSWSLGVYSLMRSSPDHAEPPVLAFRFTSEPSLYS